MRKYLLFSIIVLAALWVLSPSLASAANHYIRAGAMGANNGSDWANAYVSLPAMLNRGDTYYIADGTYGGYTFDDAVSGTTLITIKKATISDHGTDTGWNSSYGDGVAIFTSGLTFTTGYWVFDGITGSFKNGHGFHIDMTADTGVKNGIRIQASYITISHTKISWPDRDSETYMNPSSTSAGIEGNAYNGVDWDELAGINISYVYIEEVPGYPFRFIHSKGLVIEHCALFGMHSDAERHSSIVIIRTMHSDNGTIRYNWFEEGEGTGGIVFYDNVNHIDWAVYGNVFYQSGGEGGFGMGIVAANTHPNDPYLRVTNLKIYNNTIVGVAGNSGISMDYNGVNVVAYNNLWHNVPWLPAFYGFSYDYNYYSSCSGQFAFTPGAHENPWSDGSSIITSNPFVASGSGNLHLNAALPGYPGYSLGSPYNYDIEGYLRGEDGVFDRGAYEYVSGGTIPYCGDTSCNGAETCSSCPSDCGACPCTPNWQCTAWSACNNSVQTRTCTDANSCGATSGKPSESQSCTATGIFAIGDRVEVTFDPSLRVRSAPGLSDATILGNQLKDSQGTVTSGPISLDGYIWWQIDYDVSPDGWSIEPGLAKAGIDTTPPAAPTGVVVN